MSFYSDASLVMIPSGYKTSKVYSAVPTDGSGDLSFSRSNDTATRVGPDGLIEKVRTNLLTYSQDFSSAAYNKGTGGSVSANTVVAPDGTTTADAYTFASSASTFAYLSQQVSSTSTLPHTFSIYIKRPTGSGSRTLRLVISDVTTTTGSSSNFTITESWQRFEFTRTSGSSTGSVGIGFLQGTTGVTIAAGEVLDVWGAQLETGDIATSYIATTTAAVSVGPVANVPRLDYLNSSCPRLLLEPQRTNLITYSEQFDNAAWLPVNGTETANAAVSPDGYTNADQFNFNASSDSSCYQPLSGSSAAYSISIFAKYVSGGKYLYIFSPLNSDSAKVWFDIEAGTVANQVSGFTGAVQDYGNGWFRCTLTNTSNKVLDYIQFGISSTSSSRTLSASSVTYFYGAQVEAGAYATSYIPTLGAAVTRGADVASKTSATALIGQTEGVIFVEGSIIGDDSVKDNLFAALEKSSSGATMRIFNSATGNNLIADVYTGSGFSAQMNGPVIPVGQTFKAALAYKENDFAFAVNGVIVATDNSGAVPATEDFKINISIYGGLDAGVRQAQALLFKTRLSNADLAALTA